MIKKIFLCFLLVLQANIVFAFQDSLRVTLCEVVWDQCVYPSYSKEIEHIDSLGRITKTEFFHLEGCNPDYPDSNYIHTHDLLYQYDSLGNLISEEHVSYNNGYITHFITVYTYDSSGRKV